MPRHLTRLSFGLAALLALTAACSSTSNSATTGSSAPGTTSGKTGTSGTQPTASPASGEVREIEVTISDALRRPAYRFGSVLEVDSGESA